MSFTNLGLFGLITEDTPNILKTLTGIFENGHKMGSDRPLLGTRPQISSNPIKYADHYVWQTYGQVDRRRRHIGSAVHKLFRDGELGGGEFDTVGIWSVNRPGGC